MCRYVGGLAYTSSRTSHGKQKCKSDESSAVSRSFVTNSASLVVRDPPNMPGKEVLSREEFLLFPRSLLHKELVSLALILTSGSNWRRVRDTAEQAHGIMP